MSIYGKNYIDIINKKVDNNIQLEPEAGFFESLYTNFDTDFNYSREEDLNKEDHEGNYNLLSQILGEKRDTQEGKHILDMYKQTYSKINFDEYNKYKEIIDNGEEENHLNSLRRNDTEAKDINQIYSIGIGVDSRKSNTESLLFMEAKRKIEAIKKIDEFQKTYDDTLLSMKQIQQNGKKKYYQKQKQNELLFDNAGWFDSTVGAFTGSLLADPALAMKRLKEGNPVHAASYLIPGGAGAKGLTLLQNLGRRSTTGFAAGFGAEFTLQMTEEMRFQEEFLENQDYGMDDVLTNSAIGGVFNAVFAGGVGYASDAVKRRFSDINLEQEIEASLIPHMRKKEEEAELYYNENKREKDEVQKLSARIDADFKKLKDNVNHIYNTAINTIGQRKQDLNIETENAQQRLNEAEAVKSARLNITDIREEIDLKKESLLEKEMTEHAQLKTIARELDAVNELELLDLKKITKNSLEIKKKNSNSIGRLNKENTNLNKAIKNIRANINKLSKTKELKEKNKDKLKKLNQKLNSKISEKARNSVSIKRLTSENKRYDNLDKSFTGNYQKNIEEIRSDIKELKRLEQARVSEYRTEKARRDKKFKDAKEISDIAVEEFRADLKKLRESATPSDFKKRYESLTKKIKIKEKEINSVIAKEKYKIDNYLKEFDNYKKQLEIEAKKDLPSTSESYSLNKNQKAYIKDKMNQRFGTNDKGEYKKIAEREIEQIQKDSEKVLFKELDSLMVDLQQLKIHKKRQNIIDNIDNGILKQLDEYKKRKLTDEQIHDLILKDAKSYQKSINEMNFDDAYGFDNFEDVLNEIDRLLESGELQPTRDILIARWTLKKYKSYDDFLQSDQLFKLSKEERLTELDNIIELHNQQIKADMEGYKKIDYETKSDNLMKNSVLTRINNILSGNTKARRELEAVNIEGVSFLKDNKQLINELINEGRTYAEIKETLIEKIKEYNNGTLKKKMDELKKAKTIELVDGAEEVIVKSKLSYDVDEDVNNMYNNTIDQANSAMTKLPDDIMNEKQMFPIEITGEDGKIYIEEQEMTIKEYLEKNKKEGEDLQKIFEGCVL